MLHDDPLPVRAAACEAAGERGLLLTLTEGKYHQVKRMVAAAGNHVVALQRTAFGALQLPDDLAARAVALGRTRGHRAGAVRSRT